MDRLTAMTVFVEVARQEGFALAARELQMSTSAVSRHVMDLERWLDVQLFHRTTRRLSLTDAGKAYLDRCVRIVSDVDELERSAKALREDPQGEIRMTAPVFMGKHLLAPLLPEFLERYPKITVQLRLLDRVVNLVDEGFDLALRIGELADSTLIARKIGDMRVILSAAPSYLNKHGVPSSVRDLKNHNCLVDTVPEHGHRWPLTSNRKRVGVPVKGSIAVNNGELVRELTLAGLGISYLPDFFVSEDIAQGRLVRLLSDSTEVRAGLFLVYPQTKHLSSTVRVFMDFVVEHSRIGETSK